MKRILATTFLAFAILVTYAQGSSEELMAQHYYQRGEYDKALSVYQKLFNQGRSQSKYYDYYFNSLVKLKRFDEAEKLVKKMMSTYKGNFVYQVDMGRLYKEQGQQNKADEWYSRMIKALPKEEYAIRDLSVTFYRTEAYDLSVKTLLEGRKALNDDAAFTYDLLALYRYQKNKLALIQEYVNLLSKTPEIQLTGQAKSTFSTLLDTPEDYDQLRIALLKKLQKDPGNIALSDLLAWQYIQLKDFDMALKQIVALDKRLKEDGDRVYDLVSIFIANKAFEQAIEGLEYLLQKGPSNQHYVRSRMQILYTKNLQLTAGKLDQKQLSALEQEYLLLLNEFGKKATTVFAMRQLASLQAYHLNKAKSAEALLEEATTLPGVPPSTLGQAKLELGDIYILTGEVWEAALIYGQVEKDFANEPIGQEAKYRNSRLSYYQGDFVWSKAQLDVLKSSTSQLIANDALNMSLLIAENTSSPADSNALRKYARADFFSFISKHDEALKILDSINTLYPQNSLTDDILMAKAKIFQKQNLTDKTIEQLTLIVSDHLEDLWGDDALFMLGDLYETTLKNNAKAMEYYQKIVSDFPGSLYVTEARKRYRNLRGDNLG
jgi:pentatricopeptide repeat protein